MAIKDPKKIAIIDIIRNRAEMPSSNDIHFQLVKNFIVSRESTSKLIFALRNNGNIVRKYDIERPGIAVYALPDPVPAVLGMPQCADDDTATGNADTDMQIDACVADFMASLKKISSASVFNLTNDAKMALAWAAKVADASGLVVHAHELRALADYGDRP